MSIHDDSLPDQPDQSQWTDDPELRRQMDMFRGRTAKGQILRGSTLYDAEKDFVTNSALRAMLRDQADVIRMLTAENAELSQALDAQTTLNAELFRQVEALAAANQSNLAMLTTLQDTLDHLASRLK